MAKPKKSGLVAVSDATIALLTGLMNGSITRVSQGESLPLLPPNSIPQLIEVDTSDIVDGKALARITDAGKAVLNTAANPVAAPASAEAQSPYAIITNAVLPPSKRGNKKGGGAPTIYPFATMEVGQTFFVPVSEKHPDPVKTLGSTVSSMNMRLAVKTGEMKTVVRTKRGPGNKAELDAAGNKVKETVEVPVYKTTKKFKISSVTAGEKYGEWIATADGALIGRVE